jgi:hypothetical protein
MFMGTVFDLTPERGWSDPILLENGWAIVRLLEKQVADTTNLASVRDSLSGVILRQKQSTTFNRWFTDLYDRADIKDFRGQVPGSS